MNNMFSPLTKDEIRTAKTIKPDPNDKIKRLIPAPEDAEPVDSYRHGKYGKPGGLWPYHDASGNLYGYVARWDYMEKGVAKKLILPLTYCERENGRRLWMAKGIPTPRPLLNLPEIMAHHDKPVMIVEGEKTWHFAQKLFPDMVLTTPMHGAQSPHLTDFSPLSGRRVIIAPDNDEAGERFGDRICELLREAGAEKIEYLSPKRLGSLVWQGDGVNDIELRDVEELPKGWDLADAYNEGWTAERVKTSMEENPAFTLPYQTAQEREEAARIAAGEPEEMAKSPFKLTEHGVEKRFTKTDKEGNVSIIWKWICSPLEILSYVRSHDNEDWAKQLQLIDRDYITKKWIMPMSMLAGDKSEYIGRLLSMGLVLSPATYAKQALYEYITSSRPKQKARCVNRIGWKNQSFILPKETFAQDASETILFQSDDFVDDPYQVGGSLEEWQNELARYAVGNSRLVFAISSAFAAPLLSIVKEESGGFHLRGGSSIGKTTGLALAASVWGGRDYTRTWRATSNGLEGVAAMHCDTLLLLDEMGQVSPHEIGQVAYMLANGQGKNRARRDGSARKPARWNVLFLSTGELSLSDKIAEDGKGRKAAAGQEVRIVDIPADAGAGLGMFENLHGFKSANEFAAHIKKVSVKHFGHASRQFLELLTRSDLLTIERELAKPLRDFVAEYCPANADGQVKRVAARFALVAAGGEMAAAFGVVPWQAGEATKAAARCFADWIKSRGGVESAEEKAALAAVRLFIEQHGNARFELMGRDGGEAKNSYGEIIDFKVQNRAGFRRLENDTMEYLILSEVWKNEVCKGHDPKLVAQTLAKRGYLEKDSQGKYTIPQRVPNCPKLIRCYVVTSNILDGEHSPITAPRLVVNND